MRTIAIMISVGNRSHLTDITYQRLFIWATKHNYDCVLVKNDFADGNRTPHFNKLVCHKLFPDYDRYIVVDDDLLISKYAPKIDDVPNGFVGLAPDAVQENTELAIIQWTANTGFIVFDKYASRYLEEAYQLGIYQYHTGDGSNKGIWGPFDQGITNFVLFKEQKVFQLNQNWNTQFIISYYTRGKGWEEWRSNKIYRLLFYSKLLFPFSKERRQLKKIYGLHLTMGVYPKFFNKIFK